jgi:endonuclease YncB( thermonuclease family)
MSRLITYLVVAACTVTFFLFGLLLGAVKALLGFKSRQNPSFEAIPYVLDGDSLAFNNDIRIRLYGIDAPEIDHPEGQLAKRHLQNLIQNQTVRVVVKETDKYGRGIAKVFLPNGDDLSARMVADGYARAYASFTSSYVALEKKARKEKTGLWAQNGLAIHPELWRKAQR